MTRIIPPSIDPSRRRTSNSARVRRGSSWPLSGVLGGGPPVSGAFHPPRRDDRLTVTRAATVSTGEARPGEADPVVVQVSRWDKLKDMPSASCAASPSTRYAPGTGT